jgi:hypothetical protein
VKKLISFLLVLSVFFVLPGKILASGPPDYNHSSYNVSSSSVPNDGTTTNTITIHLEDSSSNNVTSDTINLSSSNDGSVVFNNSQTTDGSGNATFTIKSTTAGTTKVTMTDITNAATFVDWFTATFYSATLGCSNVPAAPVLSLVTSNASGKATLTWVDSVNPVVNYLVSYGTTSGSYIYGNSNVGVQGTTSYTVGSLINGKKYYFVVAASNNCGASGFSNEMSTVINLAPTTAPAVVQTPEPTATPPSDLSVVSVNPTDTPEDTPTPEAVATGGNTTIRDIAIAMLVLGVGILALIIIVRKNMTKKKSEIPQIPLTPPDSQIHPVPPVDSIPPVPPIRQ